MEAYSKNPIGNGPYILEDRKLNLGYKLKRNPDYKGYWKSAHPGYEVTIYQNPRRLSMLTIWPVASVVTVPPSAFNTFKEDSDKRYVIAESGVQTLLGITANTPGFGFDEAVPTFAEFLKLVDRKSNYSGFRRFGWRYGLQQASNFELIFPSNAQYNEMGYSNPEVDRLIKEGVTVPRDQASSVWGKVQELILQDLPLIPLFSGVSVDAYGKDIKNIKYNKWGSMIMSWITRE